MSADTEGLEQVTHEPRDPMEIDRPVRTCVQLDTVCDQDENGEPDFNTEREEICERPLVYEVHGNETVYMCTEHGWQATVFEDSCS